MLVDILSFVLLLAGGALVLVGGVGLLRFPDFYTRLHAASVTETLALTLIMLGLFLQAGANLIGLKLALVFIFMLLTGPVATHALARAARHGRLAPQLAPSQSDKHDPATEMMPTQPAAAAGALMSDAQTRRPDQLPQEASPPASPPSDSPPASESGSSSS